MPYGLNTEIKQSIRSGVGNRLGAAIYATKCSSKAIKYAENIGEQDSGVRILMCCRVIVGRPYDTDTKHLDFKQPPEGYHSVYGKPGTRAFPDGEYAVYSHNAIQVAYVLVLD
ncbi:hypothetical protein FRC09_014753 [Ceratobasidium sp. 395]|nr:hypothetical protein FRC09_014753 [Ceratobasidium sp. 395]